MTGVPVAEDEEVAGSRDEIRKRALLALEGGRNLITGFARVEIPDWKTPSAEKQSFDWDPCTSLFCFNFDSPHSRQFTLLINRITS
jgi:hypothetical protein